MLELIFKIIYFILSLTIVGVIEVVFVLIMSLIMLPIVSAVLPEGSTQKQPVSKIIRIILLPQLWILVLDLLLSAVAFCIIFVPYFTMNFSRALPGVACVWFLAAFSELFFNDDREQFEGEEDTYLPEEETVRPKNIHEPIAEKTTKSKINSRIVSFFINIPIFFVAPFINFYGHLSDLGSNIQKIVRTK